MNKINRTTREALANVSNQEKERDPERTVKSTPQKVVYIAQDKTSKNWKMQSYDTRKTKTGNLTKQGTIKRGTERNRKLKTNEIKEVNG